MNTQTLAAAVAAIITGSSVVIALPAIAADTHDHTHRAWVGCVYEDGSSQRRCIWRADRMGNGRGQSLKIIRGGTDDARYVPITHRRAAHLIAHDMDAR